MIAQAKGRFLPVAPRKIRTVTRLLKGQDVGRAQDLLANLPRGAAPVVAKVLESAVANATRTGAWSKEQLFISGILADEGPSAKRFRSGPMGRAMGFRKKGCHLTIQLDAKGLDQKRARVNGGA